MDRLRQYFEQLKQTYADPLDFYRVRMVLVISTVLLLGIISFLSWLLINWGGLSRPAKIGGVLGLFLLSGLISITHIYLRDGQSWPSRLLILTVASLLGLAANLYFGLHSTSSIYLIMLPLLASTLFGSRGTFSGAVLSLGIALIYLLFEGRGVIPSSNLNQTTMMISLAIGALLVSVSTVLLWFFTGNIQNILRHSQRTTQQLRTVAEIGHVANTSLDSENLLPQLVEMIRSQMAFYHVQVFLIDEMLDQAVLVASTGRGGQQLLARGHSLKVGSHSVIGQVTGRGSVVYATDTSLDPVHQVNEFLPATRSEIALPLFDGVQIMGALDVQSVRPNAFTPDDIGTLEIMANQIAIAIRNARLFERFQSSLEENQMLVESTARNLQEVERLNRQLTAQAWEEYLSSGQRDYGVQLDGTTVQRQTEWTPALQQAIREADSVVQDTGEQATIAVPLDVRGVVLGALEVTLPPNTQREDAQELAEAVANRLGLTLDNTRLFEEARTLAQQEHVINDIGGRLQAAVEVDEMLQVALLELRQVLNAESGAVRLRTVTEASLADMNNDIG